VLLQDLFLLHAAAPGPGSGGGGGGAGAGEEGLAMSDSGGPGPINPPGGSGAASTIQKLSVIFPNCVCIYAPQVRARSPDAQPFTIALYALCVSFKPRREQSTCVREGYGQALPARDPQRWLLTQPPPPERGW
jgi:hypothetical protein